MRAQDDDARQTLVTVRVPASCANLGPGYDVLAVAVDMTLTVHARSYDGRRVVARGEGASEVADDDSNLVYQAVRTFCDAYDVDPPEVTLHCDNDIPLARGLGSSSAAAVAGLALARALTKAPIGDQQIIDLATQMEGHADNAAAAMLGGLVVAGPGDRARRFEPSRRLRPLVCIPPHRSSTRQTRGLVPTRVGLHTMIDTARRTTLVLAGLTGLAAWDPAAMVDEVHEPPRLRAMSASRAVVDAARAAGYGACLSGAGPSVLVVADAHDPQVEATLRGTVGADWRVVALGWDRAGARRDTQSASR